MSLALEYRPDNLKDVVGNTSTIKEIKALLSRDREKIPHSFMFVGPSGCGKTTLGRLLAKGLGCVGNDYRELDTADFRGIEMVRDLRAQMQYAAAEGECRVFLLDECHKMTNDAQNAILKALEEAPAHVYFILATTDPQKLLPTIKNRCVQFSVQALGHEELEGMLAEVIEAEEKEVAATVLSQIVEAADGSPRAALQMLDKVIDLDPRDQKRAARRIIDEQNTSIELCRLLMKNGVKWPSVAKLLKNLEETDIEKLRLGVMGYCASVLLNGDNPQAGMIMECFEEPFYNNGKSGLVLACYRVFNE